MHYILVFCLALFFSGYAVRARVVDKEEFADALRNNGVPENQISTWQCIAEHESHYETTAHNTDTGDFGILQISQIYWCSPPGTGCGMTCDSMLDDDINNDIQCAKIVYDETQKISGDGFTAWTVYPQCRGL